VLKGLLSAVGAYKLYKKWLWQQVKNKPLPSHVAVILDGNRRWAKGRRLPPWFGHREGARKVEDLLDWCLKLGIKTLTLYVLSTENLQRPVEEVNAIFKIAEEELRRALTDRRIHENGVRVKALGRVELLPEGLRSLIKELEASTSNYNSHFLNIAIAYGGRTEIVDAVKKIAESIEGGKLRASDIDEHVIEKHLYTWFLPNPYPDLIIRTSGEERLSGFLLWQSAYSELVFLDIYWPDFREIDLLRAIRTYQTRQRRFGI